MLSFCYSYIGRAKELEITKKCLIGNGKFDPDRMYIYIDYDKIGSGAAFLNAIKNVLKLYPEENEFLLFEDDINIANNAYPYIESLNIKEEQVIFRCSKNKLCDISKYYNQQNIPVIKEVSWEWGTQLIYFKKEVLINILYLFGDNPYKDKVIKRIKKSTCHNDEWIEKKSRKYADLYTRFNDFPSYIFLPMIVSHRCEVSSVMKTSRSHDTSHFAGLDFDCMQLSKDYKEIKRRKRNV